MLETYPDCGAVHGEPPMIGLIMAQGRALAGKIFAQFFAREAGLLGQFNRQGAGHALDVGLAELRGHECSQNALSANSSAFHQLSLLVP